MNTTVFLIFTWESQLSRENLMFEQRKITREFKKIYRILEQFSLLKIFLNLHNVILWTNSLNISHIIKSYYYAYSMKIFLFPAQRVRYINIGITIINIKRTNKKIYFPITMTSIVDRIASSFQSHWIHSYIHRWAFDFDWLWISIIHKYQNIRNHYEPLFRIAFQMLSMQYHSNSKYLTFQWRY